MTNMPRLLVAIAAISVLALSFASTAQCQPSFTTLYTFSNTGSALYDPQASLALGANGLVYGTAQVGGTAGHGGVFELAPPSVAGGAWTETLLYTFTGQNGDGALPSSIVLGNNGVLYGTTEYGGTGPCFGGIGCGTVFSLTPPATPGGTWTESVLYKFGSNDFDGGYPLQLTISGDGKLYGTTYKGGMSRSGGIVFRLNPPSAGGVWTEDILYRFSGESGTGDGFQPAGGVALYNGAVYGATTGGGATGGGTVYELTPPSSGGARWTETILYNFVYQEGVVHTPTAGLTVGAGGVLYGVAFSGAKSACMAYPECGAVYALTPPASAGGTWSFTDLYDFDSLIPTDPFAVAIGANGTLFGTTMQGGVSRCGTAYRLSPPASGDGAWSYADLYTFPGDPNCHPSANLVIGAGQVLYGVTEGGSGQSGTVFSLTP